ncbi:MAG: TonB-dependent receptor family protein [Flavobacteriaceae bacterium]
MGKHLFLFASMFWVATAAFAQDTKFVSQDSLQKLDEVIIKANTILGNKYVAHNRTGASYFLSAEELADFGYIDINRALKSVPGVNFYEEDGFGLRPNISLRGTSPQRSSKITLMEDGVLIAPAPYSSPAAYYFPSVARMQAIEILKGSSQVQYGPFTTGGVINMVSTGIPEKLSGRFQSSYGSFNSSQLYTNIGQSGNNVGYVVEYLQLNSDGFKQLGNAENTGFDTHDLMGKVRWQSDAEASLPQSIELKYHYYKETSNETYLGLTEADFEARPYFRYAASQEDVMQADQRQLMLTHTLNFSTNLKMVSNVYQNTFKRNWYKLDAVTVDGNRLGLATIVSDPSAYQPHLSLLKGEPSGDSNTLWVKANNRVYTARGIQTKLDYHWYGASGAFHDLEIAVRYHYDEEDRFQWENGYSMTNSDMLLQSEGAKGAKGNRISSAQALAVYALYKYKYKGWTLTPGIRIESIGLAREDFGKTDPNRTGANLATRENAITAVIPGIGFNYTFSNRMALFGGIHKGFSPPGSAPGEEAEESVNVELGSRFAIGSSVSGELIGFFNDYSNLLGSDLAASGGTGNLDPFNAGAVHVSGAEFLLNYNPSKTGNTLQFPLTFAYTFTEAIFQSSFGSNEDIWGTVAQGDRVPYITPHQWTLTSRIEHPKYECNISIRYNGAFGTQAGNGNPNAIQEVAENLVVDVSAQWHVTPKISLSSQLVNLFDSVYVASRVPAGLRPGHPLGVYGGMRFMF